MEDGEEQGKLIIQVAADLLDQYLQGGDLVGFIIAVYTSLIGEIFFGLIILIVSIPLYLRTQSVMYCSILWITVSSLLIAI